MKNIKLLINGPILLRLNIGILYLGIQQLKTFIILSSILFLCYQNQNLNFEQNLLQVLYGDKIVFTYKPFNPCKFWTLIQKIHANFILIKYIWAVLGLLNQLICNFNFCLFANLVHFYSLYLIIQSIADLSELLNQQLESSSMRQISISQFNRKYSLKQKIGEGSYGKVFKLRDIINDRSLALKKIILQPNERIQQFIRQIQIQTYLAHPLVLQIFEFYTLETSNYFFKNKTEVGIIMQLGKKSLLSLIKDRTQKFSIQQIIKFSYQFVKLFALFQDQNIVHRDIKPQNFIQFTQGLNCKLADFGLCSHINDINGVGGSFYYLSPLLKKLHTNKNLKIKTNPFKDDVYSFGLTLYELITKKEGKYEVKNVSKDIYMSTKSLELSEIVQLMLQAQQTKRPDFKELFRIFQNKFGFCQKYYQQQIQIDIDVMSESKISKMSIQGQCKQFRKENKQSYFSNFQNEQVQFYSRTNKFQKNVEFTQTPLYDGCKTSRKQTEEDKKQFSKKTFILGNNISIMAMYKMKDFIILGCYNGNIKILHLKLGLFDLEGMEYKHTKYISTIQKDKNGNLWTASGDGSILIWNVEKLSKNLQNQNNYKVQSSEIINIYGHKKNKTYQYVQIQKNIQSPLVIPFCHKGGISSVYCIDQQNFAIGFNDGYIYSLWKGQQYHYLAHTDPVTCIKINHNKIYSGSVDGCIKVFQMQQGILNNHFFRSDNPICNFDIVMSSKSPHISAVTTNGKVLRIGLEKVQDFKQKYTNTNQQISDTLASLFLNGRVYTLNSNGVLLEQGQVFQIMESQGWNCMINDGNKCLILANFQGKVTILSWDH